MVDAVCHGQNMGYLASSIPYLESSYYMCAYKYVYIYIYIYVALFMDG